ncbi:hypothetical protein OKW43_006746 [Paraburkholderia sp. WC7.3g]|uniref:hypothetical protein n=1 Tax=Paraburkholderia sp. WC7.3g TaxID=2991070 RepID=UPI003D1F5AAF
MTTVIRYGVFLLAIAFPTFAGARYVEVWNPPAARGTITKDDKIVAASGVLGEFDTEEQARPAGIRWARARVHSVDLIEAAPDRSAIFKPRPIRPIQYIHFLPSFRQRLLSHFQKGLRSGIDMTRDRGSTFSL